MSFEKSSDLDINAMENYLKTSIPTVREAEGKALVLVVGWSSSGKTTLISYLSGAGMEQGEGNNKGKIKAKGSLWENKIGTGDDSTTFVPEVYDITSKGNDVDNEQTFAFCDCPGFDDTRSPEEKVCTTINIQLAVKMAESIRGVVVVIDYADIESRNGEGLRNLSITLSKVMKDYKAVKDSIVFVVTKKPELDKQFLTHKISNIIESENRNITKLRKYLTNNPKNSKKKKDLEKKEAQVEVLQAMKAHPENLIIANLLEDHTKQEIFERVSQLKEAPKNEFDFGKSNKKRMKFAHFLDDTYEKAIKKMNDLASLEFQIAHDEKRADISKNAMETVKKSKEFKDFVDKLSSDKPQEFSSADLKFAQETLGDIDKEIGILGTQIDDTENEIKKMQNELKEHDSEELQSFNILTFKGKLTLTWNEEKFSYAGRIPIREIRPNITDGRLYDEKKDKLLEGKYEAVFKSDWWKEGLVGIGLVGYKKDIEAKIVQSKKNDIKIVGYRKSALKRECELLENKKTVLKKALNAFQEYKHSVDKNTDSTKDQIWEKLKEVGGGLVEFYQENEKLKTDLINTKKEFKAKKEDILLDEPLLDAVLFISKYINGESNFFQEFAKKYHECKTLIHRPEDASSEENSIESLNLQGLEEELLKELKGRNEEIKRLKEVIQTFFKLIPPQNKEMSFKPVSLYDIKHFQFGKKSSKKKIDDTLAQNGLYRGIASIDKNNCLLDTYFQLIQSFLQENHPSLALKNLNETDFIEFVRREAGILEGVILSANGEQEGVRLLQAVQKYLDDQLKLKAHFDLTILVADQDNELFMVDNIEEIQGKIQIEKGSIKIPLCFIQINFDHYEPLYSVEREIKKITASFRFFDRKEKPVIQPKVDHSNPEDLNEVDIGSDQEKIVDEFKI